MLNACVAEQNYLQWLLVHQHGRHHTEVYGNVVEVRAHCKITVSLVTSFLVT